MLEALARQALGQASIICINPPISLRESISLGGKSCTQGMLPFFGPECLTENLYVGTPVVWISGGGRRCKLKGSSGWRIVGRQIRNAIRKTGNETNKIISWIYRPEQLHCLKLAGEECVVYECYDEYNFSPIDGIPVRDMIDWEAELLGKADLVFTTSMALFESRLKRHPLVKYAPNGVDFDHFNQALTNDLDIPEDLVRIPPPRIGYIGNISRRIDFDVLESIVSIKEDCSFVFIGSIDEGVKKEVKSLDRYLNVHFLGFKCYPRLPNYLKAFNACIIPYKLNLFNDNSNPLKLWEYMAAGRLIISLGTVITKDLSDIVYVAKNKEEFIRHIDRALKNESPSRIKKGIQIAKKHSWDILTHNMFELIKRNWQVKERTREIRVRIYN